MKCEYCGEPDAKIVKAMTAYHFEGERNSPEDPNRDLTLCEQCKWEYEDHWEEMWAEANYNKR